MVPSCHSSVGFNGWVHVDGGDDVSSCSLASFAGLLLFSRALMGLGLFYEGCPNPSDN
jgi:hypothetical protein